MGLDSYFRDLNAREGSEFELQERTLAQPHKNHTFPQEGAALEGGARLTARGLQVGG